MKLNKTRHLVLTAGASLMAATLVTACSQFTQTLTVDYVFVTCSKAAASSNAGEINVFEINSESGRMRQIPSSPFPSGGRNPVAEAVSADNGSLFVANQDDQNIVQFLIGSDGKLYPNYTVNTPGIYPLALAANKSNLFAVTLFQPLPLCSTAQPCSGAISVFPLTAGTSSNPVTMGTPVTNTGNGAQYWPLSRSDFPNHVIVPTAVNVLASGSYVYVTAYDSTASPNVGCVFAFAVGSDGVLTSVNSSPCRTAYGSQPSAIASDAAGSYVYVTDKAKANVLGFAVGSDGGLTTTGTFAAGNQPAGIAVDSAYPYAYVVNYQDGTITAYSASSGTLTPLGGSITSSTSTYTAGLQPVAIGIDPSTERFLFTANYLGNNISGFELNKTDGTLLNSQYSPYTSNSQPTAVAAVPHNGTGGGVQQ